MRRYWWWWSRWFLILCVSWTLLLSTTHGIQSFYQTQLLLQLRKHLEYPKALDILESYNGDLCNLSSTPNVTIICQNDSITELKIIGDKLGKVSEFNGFAIPNKTLSATFSVDSFVTTLTRLTSLKVLCLVSLGIWGPLPDKIHRLNSLQLLDFSSNFMFGVVPSELSRLTKLNSLTLDSNYFNGTVPDWLDSFSGLTILSLKSNRFSGHFPSSVPKMSSLNAVALSHNQLNGKLPDLSLLKRLHVLDLRENKFDSGLPGMPKGLVTVLLSNNSFSGKIPEQFGRLNQLQHLDLSSNRLSGTPPAALFSLPNISYLNLSSNVLSGQLPDHFKCGSKLGVVDISANKLTGAVPSCLDSKSGKREVKFGGNCFSLDGQNQHQESYCEESNVERNHSKCREIGVLVAVVCGAVVVLGLVALGIMFLCRRIRSKKTYEHNIIAKVVQDSAPTGVSSDVLASARFISQAAKLGTQGGPVSRVFPMEELKEATNNFDSLAFIGQGSLGKVYRGRLSNGTNVAIRAVSLSKKYSIQNLKVRLELLSKIHHPNLVAFMGHCIHASTQDDPCNNKLFLVHEYVYNGNYRCRLSDTFSGKVLNWSDRLTILIAVAKAVHFLHTGVIPGVLNNRLKTSNILLDEHQVAKLSDYGMSILTEEIERVDKVEQVKGGGQKSRHLINMEDDVYNFGFILLESLVGPIVTGKGETFLLNEMASFGSQDGRKRIVDPVVLTTCSQESLSIAVSITSKCISPEPSARPSFEDVLWNLQYAAQVQATADAEQKSDTTS